jgi:sugar lactone lactonase YvrE
MKKLTLASFLCGLVLAACVDNNGGDDDNPDDTLPGFTNGVSTLSGHAEPGFVDGPRGEARFANPVNVAYGPDGKLYVADFDNGKIRVVDPKNGQTGTLIAQQGFKRPFAMAFAPDGTLYVTTDANSSGGPQGPMTGTVWRVSTSGRTATVVAENVGRPRGIAVLPDGRLAISDYQHHVIQLVDPASGAVTRLAGTWDSAGMVDGSSARFDVPYGVAVRNGQLVVADQGNNRLRTVALDGTVQTLAGEGAGFADGAMAGARFNRPQAITAAPNGDLYITDTENYRVRRISGDSVQTIAGNGEPGYRDDDNKLAGQFYGLEGLSVSSAGDFVYVADGGRGEDLPYNRVRMIKLN